MSNLTVAGFVPYQAPWILYLAIHIKRVEIELKTHSTILLQNLFAGSNYPWGRYYLPKINAKQISFPSIVWLRAERYTYLIQNGHDFITFIIY